MGMDTAVMGDETPIGDWLRSVRVARGQTQAEAARACAVSLTQWSAWERGLRRPVKLGALRAIAEWADVSAEEVLRRCAQ